jgi:hypothetical protein
LGNGFDVDGLKREAMDHYEQRFAEARKIERDKPRLPAVVMAVSVLGLTLLLAVVTFGRAQQFPSANLVWLLGACFAVWPLGLKIANELAHRQSAKQLRMQVKTEYVERIAAIDRTAEVIRRLND